jgi:hypothetical protein
MSEEIKDGDQLTDEEKEILKFAEESESGENHTSTFMLQEYLKAGKEWFLTKKPTIHCDIINVTKNHVEIKPWNVKFPKNPVSSQFVPKEQFIDNWSLVKQSIGDQANKTFGSKQD